MATGCIECHQYLDQRVFIYSIKEFGAPLCRLHQDWIRNSDATETAIQLYFALRRRGVPAKLEKWDGHKTIDIAIPDCKLNIEVDGMQHSYNPDQALSDLQRTYYSFLKGYLTLRVPNSLVDENLDEAADYITKFLEAKDKQDWKRHW
jgi:very-short-patch-repair endonuclease